MILSVQHIIIPENDKEVLGRLVKEVLPGLNI